MANSIKPVWETLPVPPQHDTLKEILYLKTTSSFYLAPYGVLKILFKSEEAMAEFSIAPFKHLGASWTKKLKQNFELEAVFFDPKVDQHKIIDEAIDLFRKLLK